MGGGRDKAALEQRRRVPKHGAADSDWASSLRSRPARLCGLARRAESRLGGGVACKGKKKTASVVTVKSKATEGRVSRAFALREIARLCCFLLIGKQRRF